MSLTRRDLLKASAVVAGALGVTGTGIMKMREAVAKEGGLQVVWLQGQACTGCSVSLLNSIYYTTIDDLLLNTLDLQYHPNISGASGDLAISAAEEAYTKGGYALVVEGAIPTAYAGRAAFFSPTMTFQAAVQRYASRAALLIAVGTCASYGGMAAGAPNPTGARPLSAIVPGKAVVNIPGCPVHPDWVVGTIAYILANGKVPPLDSKGRPTDFYGKTVHSACPNIRSYTGPNHHSRGRPCITCHGPGREEDTLNASVIPAATLSDPGCLWPLGCKGVVTGCDCPTRKWNGAAAASPGVNWCIGARSPCFGCTEPNFPDGMEPFYTTAASSTGGGGTGGGGNGGGGDDNEGGGGNGGGGDDNEGGGGNGGGGDDGGGTGGGGGRDDREGRRNRNRNRRGERDD